MLNLFDAAGNVVGVAQGAQEIKENGFSVGATVRVASSGLGLAGNLVGAAKAADEVADLKNTSSNLENANPRPACLQDSCFAAGTPLLTPTGASPIESFRVGDLILSRSEDAPDGPVVAKRVLRTFQTYSPLLALHIGGRVIRTTAKHPFWVESRGWIAAEQVEKGELLLGAEGEQTMVRAIERMTESSPVYNMEVEDYHTYMVGEPTWGFSVWSHNADGPCGSGAAYDAANGQGLYILRDPDSEIRYVGRGDAPARILKHAEPGSGKEDLVGEILFNNDLPAAQAMSLEQELMQALGGPKSVNPGTALRNKVQSLGESNQNFVELEFAADDDLVIEALRRAGIIGR
jgi:Pretoxin HINT domain